MESGGEPRTKLPFHDFCVKTGSLCDECDQKLRTGIHTEQELRLSKVFIDLRESRRSIADITMNRAVRRDNLLVIELGQNDLEKLGDEVRDLTKAIKSGSDLKVTFVESGVQTKTFLSQLAWPNKAVSMNTVWLPDGSKQTAVNLDGRRSAAELRTLEEMAKELRGLDTRFEAPRG